MMSLLNEIKTAVAAGSAQTLVTVPVGAEVAISTLFFNAVSGTANLTLNLARQASGTDVDLLEDFPITDDTPYHFPKPIMLQEGDVLTFSAIGNNINGMVGYYQEGVATTTAGILNPRGSYSGPAVFDRLDVVEEAGSSYICLTDGTSGDPPPSDNWMLLSAQGDAGTTDYAELSNLPTLGTAAAQNVGAFASSAQGGRADSAVQPADLAAVALSGDYADLTNKPAVPDVDIDLIKKPVMTSPADNATDVGKFFTLEVASYGSVYDRALLASQWQVSEAGDFSTTVLDTGDVMGPDLDYPVAGSVVDTDTAYFARCRQKDEDGEYSDWSDAITFTTKDVFPPAGEVQKLVASDATEDDYFGRSVAIDGNYSVVGAYGEDTGGSSAGAAYVFELSGGTWGQTQKLVASDAAAGDSFGNSVAITGTTIFVAAKEESNGRGAVYVFELSGGTWGQTQKLVASDASIDDSFGDALSVSGDYLSVGAGLEGTGGAAYVFELSGGTWSQTQKLVASDDQSGDFFGRSLAIDGTTLVVGAYGEDTGGSLAGAVYVFELSGGTWSQTQKLVASDATEDDYFGRAVSISGTTLAVGADGEDTGGTSAGAVYVFELSGGTWSQTQILYASDPVSNGGFGTEVILTPDFLLVGADDAHSPLDTVNDTGAVYVFVSSGGVWGQSARLHASDFAEDDSFGTRVASDGITTFIGAHGQDTGGSSAGAVYVFE